MPIFVETYRATVAPSDCDHLGHMNVKHYFAAVSDGMFASGDDPIRIGITLVGHPNNVCSTQKLVGTGHDLHRGVPRRGCRRNTRDHLAVWLHSPDAIPDRRECFHVLATSAAPTSITCQRMLRLHPEVQFRFADHIRATYPFTARMRSSTALASRESTASKPSVNEP